MEDIQPLKLKLQMLANQLNLTKPDDEAEEMILTEQEIEEATQHAINMAIEHNQYKRLQMGEPLEVINAKLWGTDWLAVIDIESVLKTTNSNKHHEIWLQNKRLQEKADEEKKKNELGKLYSAKFVYQAMCWYSKQNYDINLKVTNGNKTLIQALCFFISNDPRFETDLGYSFKKGMLIRGTSGLGKTFLVDCIKDNEIKPIKVYSMIEISEKVKEDGNFLLPPSFFQSYICLDDVGTEEPTVKYFGTSINFFKSFIEKYYLKNTSYEKLIFSTNDSFAILEEKYGFRVRSRLKDMFNVIDVTGEDMRG